jgi:hypothetical protein
MHLGRNMETGDVTKSVEAPTNLYIWLTKNSCEIIESQPIYVDNAFITNAIYDFTLDYFQGRTEPSEIQCYMMSTSDWSSIEDTEVPIQESEKNARESAEKVSSNTSTPSRSERIGHLRTFGVSSRCELMSRIVSRH